MNQHWIEQTYLLVDEIKTLPEYIRLLELKKQIETDEVINQLIQTFHTAQNKYNDVTQYGSHHPDLKQVRQEFSEAKYTLFTHDVVVEYKALESKIQSLLDDISKQLATTISNKIKFPNAVGIIPKH